MSVQIAARPVTTSLGNSAPNGIARLDPENMEDLDVESSYDGSNIVFHLLRLDTWGPGLMNLGFYEWTGPLGSLNLFANMEFAQRRLVLKVVDLLMPEDSNRVLDVACGRGKSSFMLSCTRPGTTVVGLDLLEDNIRVARTLYGNVQGLSYRAGSSMDLQFADESFDRVMCIEAAFHFLDRGQFLREAFRVLSPGGRLVVVDFAWNSDADHAHRDDDETKLVRDIWQWNDFSSVNEYETAASDAGFQTRSRQDWSRHVTNPIQQRFRLAAALGNSNWGRRLLDRYNPMYRSVSKTEWSKAKQAVKAHDHVQRYSKYMAFVFEKPVSGHR